jgi:hypothetical protein
MDRASNARGCREGPRMKRCSCCWESTVDAATFGAVTKLLNSVETISKQLARSSKTFSENVLKKEHEADRSMK